MIELGRKYKDKITGFEGTATGYVQYITGCNQALIVPPLSSDGSLRESQWLDVQRLAVQDADRIVLDNGATPGCDRAAPKR